MTYNEWANGKTLTIHNATKEQLKWMVKDRESIIKNLLKVEQENKEYVDTIGLLFCGLTDVWALLTDEQIEELWDKFTDIAMNTETECIEEFFLHFGIGTHREKIWKWFDKFHSKGVAYLLYDREVKQ